MLTVEVNKPEKCDLCGGRASYDARLPGRSGVWAYLCHKHFHIIGCELGLGKGQKLVYEEIKKQLKGGKRK